MFFKKMTSTQTNRNWLAVTGIGTTIVLSSLWLPWMFVPAEVALERDGMQDLIAPGSKELFGPLATMETGLWGAMDLGILVPSWIFIILIAVSGLMAFLTISRIFVVSFWIHVGPIIIATIFLTYWAGSSLALGCSLGAGFPFATIGSVLIVFAAIKCKQEVNKKSCVATGGSGSS